MANVKKGAPITVSDASAALGVPKTTIRTWLQTGRLEGVHRGKVWYIEAAAFKALLAGDDLGAIRGDAPDAMLDRLAAFLNEAAPDVCPRCTKRPIEPGPEGWCAACVSEKRVAEEEKKRRARDRKLRWWNEHGQEWRAARAAREAQDVA